MVLGLTAQAGAVELQITLEASITKSTQMQTFEETPSPEIEPVIRAQLIEEVELRAQRLLTEQLAAQPGFQVVPFGETWRLFGNLGFRREWLSDAQLRALADESGADIIVTGRIPDYGAVRWQYRVGGWAMMATAHLMIVGFASGWNPTVVGGFMALDLSTDLPFGGAGHMPLGGDFDLCGSKSRPCRQGSVADRCGIRRRSWS